MNVIIVSIELSITNTWLMSIRNKSALLSSYIFPRVTVALKIILIMFVCLQSWGQECADQGRRMEVGSWWGTQPIPDRPGGQDPQAPPVLHRKSAEWLRRACAVWETEVRPKPTINMYNTLIYPV